MITLTELRVRANVLLVLAYLFGAVAWYSGSLAYAFGSLFALVMSQGERAEYFARQRKGGE